MRIFKTRIYFFARKNAVQIGAVLEDFRNSLSRTITLLNFLVILAPLLKVFGLQNKHSLLMILEFAFYTGFILLAYYIYSFTKQSSIERLLKEKAILCFDCCFRVE